MSDSPEQTGPEGIDGRRRRFVLVVRGTLIVLAVGVAVFGLGLVGYRLFTDDTDAPDGDPAELVDDGEDDVGPPVAVIGPEPGTDVAAYISRRESELAQATDERVAIVSFTSYLADDVAEQLLADVEVGVLWVALPGDEPTTTSDVGRLRADRTAEASEQLPALRELLPTVDDPEFADFYAAEIERYESILAAGATPEIVFGAVVRADAEVLRSLARQESVRLVDVGASGALTPDAVLRAVRPEETTTAGTPVTRPEP